MTVVVLRGDARRLPLPDACVDLVVTSPPYFGLRSYTDGGEHYGGQIGSEATPAEWVANLLDCTREWVRVLKPAGSIFVNLGDKYVGGIPGGHVGGTIQASKYHDHDGQFRRPTTGHGLAVKSLMGLPWRYALAVTDQLGLILRAEIIWAKPNGLPESVTDRVRRAHEQVFHFTRLPRYYSAVDEIREPQVQARGFKGDRTNGANPGAGPKDDAGLVRKWNPAVMNWNPLGKLPGSVWDIASQPLTVPPSLGVDHFAAFPMELPRRIIQGWSPPGVCVACGEGRRPVAERAYEVLATRTEQSMAYRAREPLAKTRMYDQTMAGRTTITGYACACPQPTAPTRPSVILDPFGGTGTTALVAAAYGRHGISVDMSADYCRLAAWRTTDPAQLAAALEVPKPPPVTDGQGSLFTRDEVAP